MKNKNPYLTKREIAELKAAEKKLLALQKLLQTFKDTHYKEDPPKEKLPIIFKNEEND